jgi:hypothetical protein
MPEWQFDYFLSATQTRLIIMIEYILESPDEKFQYNYFYSSIKQIYN